MWTNRGAPQSRKPLETGAGAKHTEAIQVSW
jgi:hypothetical protein